MTAPYHEIYTAYPQPYLLRENFKPTEAQLQFAKQSLIEKHKIANGIQQLLFCKKANLSEEQFMSLNDKNLIQNQRKKYVDFIKKNYNEKIGEELFDMGKLKRRIREFQHKQNEEEEKVLFQTKGNNLAEQELLKRRREQKATAGKKKVKVDTQNKQGKEKGQKGRSSKGPSQVVESDKKPELQNKKQDQQQNEELQQIQSEMDLLNSIMDEDEEIEQLNYEEQ